MQYEQFASSNTKSNKCTAKFKSSKYMKGSSNSFRWRVTKLKVQQLPLIFLSVYHKHIASTWKVACETTLENKVKETNSLSELTKKNYCAPQNNRVNLSAQSLPHG